MDGTLARTRCKRRGRRGVIARYRRGEPFVSAFFKRCLGLVVAVAIAPAAMAGLSDWHVTPGGTQFDLNFTANWQPYSTSNVNPNNPNAPASGFTNGIDWTIWDNYGPHG